MCHNVPGDVITTRRAIVVMRGLEDEGRIRPRDTPVIAATALITVFRDNYELVRAHCAARHRSRRRFFLARARTCLFRRCADTKKKKERELVVVVVAVLGGGRETDEQKRGRPQVYAIACASGCVRARTGDGCKQSRRCVLCDANVQFTNSATTRGALMRAASVHAGWRTGSMQFVPQFLPAPVTRDTRPLLFSRRARAAINARAASPPANPGDHEGPHSPRSARLADSIRVRSSDSRD